MYYLKRQFFFPLAVLLLLPLVLSSAVYVVNNFYTGPGADTIPGTLMWAADSAAYNPGYDLISFAVSGRFSYTPGGEWYIDLGYNTELDGSTAPGGPFSVIIDSIEIRMGGSSILHEVVLKKAEIYCYGDGAEIYSNIIDSIYGEWAAAIYLGGNNVDVYYNMITRPLGDISGIYIYQGTNDTIMMNYIGIDTLGSRGMGCYDGIEVYYDASNIFILDNVISGNKNNGIVCYGDSVYIQGNFIGLTPDGMDTVGNYFNGILFTMFSGSGSYALIEGNCISGNGVNNNTSGYEDDYAIYANRIKHLVIKNNYIGVDTTGTKTLGNGGGIYLDPDLWSGNPDSAVICSNLVSGNKGHAMVVYGEHIQIYDNNIGLNAYGDSAFGNTYRGIYGWLKNSLIQGNYICGNYFGGIYLRWYYNLNPDSNGIYGNYVGLGPDGFTPFKNRSFGVRIDSAHGNVIGEPLFGPNYLVDPLIIYYGSGNVVQENYIGVDTTRANGPGVEGNHGIYINASQYDTIYRNLIYKCGKDGIRIDGGSSHTLVILNGIYNCDSSGITVIGDGSDGNILSMNSIYNSIGLAIDLGNDGVTVNDSGDIDTGPNELFNYPVIQGANQISEELFQVYGYSTPYSTVELYWVNYFLHPSGHGDAYEFLDSTVANDTGYFEVNVNLVSGSVITALARENGTGNTSELSGNFVLPGPAPDIALSENSHDYGYVTPGDSADWTLTIYNQGDDTLIVDSLVCQNGTYFAVVSPTFPQNISPGASIDVLVRFYPTDSSNVYDTLYVFSNDPDEGVVTVYLSGGPSTGIEHRKTPGELYLRLLTPNLIKGSAILEFGIPEKGDVEVSIYDASGRIVKTLLNKTSPPGHYRFIWDGRTNRGGIAPTGIYFVVLRYGSHKATERLIKIR